MTLRDYDAATIHRLALAREPFAQGKLTGTPGTVEWSQLAQARAWAEREHNDMALLWIDHVYRQVWGDIDYTVLSFDMPIAILVRRYWFVLPHHLSGPSRLHQRPVRGLVHLHEPLRRKAA
jgi:hypothetical protein